MQGHNIFLLKLPEHFYLSHGGLFYDFVVVWLFKLLDCNWKEGEGK